MGLSGAVEHEGRRDFINLLQRLAKDGLAIFILDLGDVTFGTTRVQGSDRGRRSRKVQDFLRNGLSGSWRLRQELDKII